MYFTTSIDVLSWILWLMVRGERKMGIDVGRSLKCTQVSCRERAKSDSDTE